MKIRLKEIRKSRKLTQQELADSVGLNRATISKYESGEIEPPIKMLYDLAFELDVSIYELMPGLEDQKGVVENSIEEGWLSFQEMVFLEWGYTFSDDETRLIKTFSLLNHKGQNEAIKRINEMAHVPDYQLKDNAENEERRIILSTGYGCSSLDNEHEENTSSDSE